MAVLFVDGQEHYTGSSEFLQKYSAVAGGGAPTVTSGQGRFGGKSLRYTGFGGGVFTKEALPNSATLICGFAYRFSALPVSTSDMFRFLESGASQVALQMDSTGHLVMGGVTSTNTMAPNVYYFIEVKATIHNTAGAVKVNVNGDNTGWIPATGSLNTRAGTANNYANGVYFTLFGGSSYTHDWCHIYIADTSGAAPRNDILGDCKVETLRPTAEGATINWTPSAGSDNALTVDETTPNSTDYNSSSSVGDVDTLVAGDLATSGGTIFAVQTVLVARKTDAGLRQIAPVIRQSSTDYVGTTVTLSTTDAQYRQVYNQDPTSTDWSIANVNADEWGYKLIS